MGKGDLRGDGFVGGTEAVEVVGAAGHNLGIGQRCSALHVVWRQYLGLLGAEATVDDVVGPALGVLCGHAGNGKERDGEEELHVGWV